MNFIARRKSVAANVATILLLFAIATEKVNINIIRVNGNEEQLHQHHHHQHDNGNGQGEILHFFNGDEIESRTEEQEEEEDVLIYFNGINGGFETVEEKAEPETVYEDDDFFIPSPAAPVPKMPTPYKKPYNKHKPKKPVPTPTEHPTPKPSSGPTYRTIPVPYPKSPKPTPNPTPVPTPNPTPKPTPRPTPSTPGPTRRPTPDPTPRPTNETALPTRKPSYSPTTPPSLNPTNKPTATPSRSPVISPTASPSSQPTKKPTRKPSPRPSPKPTRQSSQPTTSMEPSELPTGSEEPSEQPTEETSEDPTTASPTEFFFNGRDDIDIKSPSESPTSSPTTLFSLEEIICSDANERTFSSLCNIINQIPELKDSLEDDRSLQTQSTTYTVFAPTNRALRTSLPFEINLNSTAFTEDEIQRLEPLIKYHLLQRNMVISFDDLACNSKLQTLNGTYIQTRCFTNSREKLQKYMVGRRSTAYSTSDTFVLGAYDPKIIEYDIQATNGVLHVVNKVIQ